MTPKRIMAGALSALCLFYGAALAGPIGWRSDGTGQYPEEIPPLRWGIDSNVLWKVPTRTWSNATVVSYRDRLFYGEEPDVLVCASKEDGEELWRVSTSYSDLLPGASAEAARKQEDEIAVLQGRDRELAVEDRQTSMALQKDRGNAELKKQLGVLRQERNQVRRQIQALQRNQANRPPATHNTNGYSSATPVVDGRQIYVLYGTGAAASYDLDGNRIWARIVGRPKNGWGHSASPVLVDGTLVVHLADTVYGLEPDTGQTRWTAASNQFWGTPFPFAVGKRTWAVLTTGGVVIRVRDGRILARGVGVMPWSSPVASDGVLYIVDEKGAFAYRIPETDADQLTFEKLWQVPVARDRYYASPLIHEGLIYNVNQKGVMTVLDISDGSTVYTHTFPLRGTYYQSVTLAGAFIFVSSDTGKTMLFLPGREYREVGMNQLDPYRTNLVFEGTRIYVRTLKFLYCLGKKD